MGGGPYYPVMILWNASTVLPEKTRDFSFKVLRFLAQRTIGGLLPISRQLLMLNPAYKFIEISFKVYTKGTKDDQECPSLPTYAPNWYHRYGTYIYGLRW